MRLIFFSSFARSTQPSAAAAILTTPAPTLTQEEAALEDSGRAEETGPTPAGGNTTTLPSSNLPEAAAEAAVEVQRDPICTLSKGKGQE